MAGSASNWFKPASGPLKGRSIYLPRSAQRNRSGVLGRADVLSLLEAGSATDLYDRALLGKAAINTQPARVAKTSGRTSVAILANAPRPMPAAQDPDGAVRAWTSLGDSAPGYDAKRSGDRALYAMTYAQGFHGRAHAVTPDEMDQLARDGREVLWRGATPAQGRTGAELLSDLNSGDYYAGVGIYGNGTYFASGTDSDDPRTGRIVAISFAKSNDRRGGVIRAVLHPDARIGDFEQLTRESEKWADQELDRYQDMWRAMPPEQRRSIRNPKGEDFAKQRDAINHIRQDLGLYAAMMGYDAIRVPRGYDTGSFDPVQNEPAQMVVLNRSALIVETPPRAWNGLPT